MKNVLIIQKSLVQYRKDFFDQLRNALHEEGVTLSLVYGKENEKDGLKNDEVDLEWSTYIPNKMIKLGGGNLIWQPCLRELKHQDLVIVESANKLILNYLLMIARHFSKLKLGFWGHGRNMQDAPDSRANRFKYLFLKNCNWWFAYTAGVKEFLIEKGYPAAQITAVQNAIDTRLSLEQYAQTTDAEAAQLKAELGINSQQVGIFCGGMYPEKQIDFLLECCLKIKERLPDFHMIFIGSGIDAQQVRSAADQYRWIHYVGPKFGKDRVVYFKIASLFLMPGLVGLAILDSFAFETPIVTTNYEFHSPEIEYLEPGKNGIIVDNTIDDYSHAVVDILSTGKYELLLDYCKISAEQYTIEAMVENFKNGILQALK
ncbi:glycosyltransferase family 4 protein [Haliscomenobacter hydrossis]|uniref:Glycosyl transferase group 1 n=1 Tax=Haliscomenobacter hydrossis (strain ATCC 27775 / DSM 1100 / LMG 10767 / O) TaxID=760192 RepID=F4KR29_HALH1|nr:glycosyltransferase family 4 protein [Haliscomenobacter hydrossis]AEE53267.1 glycosyl transferase group 1 [Haliscomenobacter hydrossis DSM 1100]